MRKITTIILALAAVACAARQPKGGLDEASIRKFMTAQMAISALYVDTVNQSQMIEDAIRGMLDKLDPHSSYSTPAEVKKMNEPLQGEFDGIGVQFNMVDDSLMVIQPTSGGPSEKAGILAGDRIVECDGVAIAGVKMDRDEIMRRLRGPRGTTAKLVVVRHGIGGKLNFSITRAKIPVKSIDAAYMIAPAVGYIRIASFGATTHAEFVEKLEMLQGQGMRSLLLDLQGNGGGYMQAAVDVANELLEPGEMIVYTKGRSDIRRDFKAKGSGRFRTGKVVVLVDSYTASAAEIVSGAIQDNDRGTIVGRRSFGKGLVQRPIDLPDGSMIRLTIAHYYTPAGRCIQKPYAKGKQKDYAEDILHRLQSGELTSKDSIHFPDSLKCFTLKSHRTVYGGGGIMPDIYVPLDTNRITKYYSNLSAKSNMIQIHMRYTDNNRKKLHKLYPDFESFRNGFEMPQAVVDSIVADGQRKGARPKDEAEREATLPLLRLQLKALVARDLWDMNEYYAIMNTDNAIVKAALKEF